MAVMVTSGPTKAWIDRIRYIANTSSGAVGARIAEAFANRGYTVYHLRGCGAELPSLDGVGHVTDISVETVDDLIRFVREQAGNEDITAVVHVMAVLDYVPQARRDDKKSSGDETWSLELVRTPKVTALIRELLPDVPVVGFKLEAGVSEDELIRRAVVSRNTYDLSAVVANDMDRVGPERHEALLIGPDDRVAARCATKREIADAVVSFLDTYTSVH
jgi:phosphopantothenoylcysteine synthetase/decarboxylase